MVLVLLNVQLRGPWTDGLLISFCILGLYSALVADELDRSFGPDAGPRSRNEWSDAGIRALRSFGLALLGLAAGLVTLSLLWWAFGRPA